ncbi:M48 family metallopeptidase [Acidaminobacter hydrogenoformans]|uniref:YgjP-like metallopeptidase domain-containing protein n=1 Tax=Acidaminobacter hydrogenoformans DSM 2784 TaxID=1120920 RepID=A0A1G5S4G8_9FIRM|nr:SprT family zinc-dependent metalloprotease [Acidaminobacter hydrogenoformans]SCZ80631.1 hypothetical protein SAMN03080599_02368 [Acidaminobacter hydrogenoformans DSM 2784]
MATPIHFIHGGHPYEVAVRRERRKDLRLKVRPPGVIVAVLPQKADIRLLENFLERRRAEIGHYLDRLAAYEAQVRRYCFKEGEIITIAEKPFRIVVDAVKQGYEIKASLDGARGEIRLLSGAKPVKVPSLTYAEQAALAVEGVLMAYAKLWFSSRVEYYGQRMALTPKAVKISRAKTRYGSCSSRGNLNFCWRVLLAPQFVADYIVVHELAHLAHLNHSKAFYAVVERALPDYREAQKWLKANAALLEWPV